MSSSDSDDECYGNAAQTLKKIQGRQVKKFDDISFNDSGIEDTVKTNASTSKVVSNTSVTPQVVTRVEDIDVLDESTDDLDQIILENTSLSKRSTRSNSKRKNAAQADNVSSIESEPPRKTRRGSNRARGRGRGNKRNSRTNQPATRPPITNEVLHSFCNYVSAVQNGNNCATYNNIPTYSVGNTADYPDNSDSQPLFSSKKTDDIVTIDDNDDDYNEEMTVIVHWQSAQYFKFTLRRFQKLTMIYNFFIEQEKVDCTKLLFTYLGKPITQDQTLDSIKYSIGKLIEGGILSGNVTRLVSKGVETVRNGVKLKFQCLNVKRPFETVISLDTHMKIAMTQCAEHIERPLNQLKFEFDGDMITGKETPRDLDLEGGECIDVKFVS